MMLQALIAYADRQRLGTDDDAFFQLVDVRWEISLARDGKLAADPIPLRSDELTGKKNARRIARPFTSVNELGQGDKSHFLCDSLERATLFLDPKVPAKAAARRVQHGYFKSLLVEAEPCCPKESPELQAILAFLADDNELSLLHRRLADAKAKPTDNALFTVGGRNLLDSDGLKSFWRSRRRGMPHVLKTASDKTPRVCIASGQLADTIDATDKIKGIPGGLSTGTSLVSFGQSSFCSYGLEQAQNAALSASAELKIRLALNELVETSRSQGLVFNEHIHLHWTRSSPAEDLTSLLAQADDESVTALLHSARDGKEAVNAAADTYYAACLSGNGGRIIVRDWFESTIHEVRRNMAEWYSDLGLIQPDGSGVRHHFKFGALLYSMVREELSELPPVVSTGLFSGALRGQRASLPQTVLAAAVRRQHSATGDRLDPARLAVIKVCLLRLRHRKETDTVSEKLDPHSRDRAYLCGRLFAVLERLQKIALGSYGTSTVDRTYSSAATRPAMVFGPLFMKVPIQLRRANTRYGGSGTNKQKEIEKLCASLEALGGIPQLLTLEEQGRFSLGYYCQMAQYRADRAEVEEADQSEGNDERIE